MLVVDDVIHAFFFGIVEGAYAPAKAELVDQAFFLREYIQRAFGPVAGEDEGGIARLGHADEGVGVGVLRQLTGVVADGVAEEGGEWGWGTRSSSRL